MVILRLMDRSQLFELLDRETAARRPWAGSSQAAVEAWCTRQPAHEVAVPPLQAHLLAIHLEGPSQVGYAVGGTRTLRGRTVPGDVTFIPAGADWHSSVFSDVGFLHVWIPDALVANVGAERGIYGNALHDRLAVDAPSLLRLGVALLTRPQDASESLFEDSLAHRVAAGLLEAFGPRQIRRDVPRGGLTAHQASVIREYVRANLATALRLEELARLVGLSTFHFARCFKTTFGMAPHQYVIRARVQEAKALLAGTARALDQVANQVGFATQSRFTTVFGAQVGFTPAAFRRVLRGGGPGPI